jgi:hypothetical protein
LRARHPSIRVQAAFSALLSLELRNIHQKMFSGILDGTAPEQEACVIAERINWHRLGKRLNRA